MTASAEFIHINGFELYAETQPGDKWCCKCSIKGVGVVCETDENKQRAINKVLNQLKYTT